MFELIFRTQNRYILNLQGLEIHIEFKTHQILYSEFSITMKESKQ